MASCKLCDEFFIKEKALKESTDITGKLVYDVYYLYCDGKSTYSGVAIPEWIDQKLEVQDSWESLAMYIKMRSFLKMMPWEFYDFFRNAQGYVSIISKKPLDRYFDMNSKARAVWRKVTEFFNTFHLFEHPRKYMFDDIVLMTAPKEVLNLCSYGDKESS